MRKQFAFTIYLINILLLPLIYENGRHPFSYPHRYVSELLFLKIQEKIQSGKDEANKDYEECSELLAIFTSIGTK